MNAAAPAATAGPPVAAGSARQLAWLYSPPDARPDVAALLTLEAEIDAGNRPGIEHDVAHARLGWWLEETAALAAGRPRHPLGRQLTQGFAQAGLSPPDLRGLADVARLDLACTAFESAPEYADYLSRWSQALFRSLALRLEPATAARADVERFCGAAGAAVRDIELVARLASDAVRGRLHVVLGRATAGDAPGSADPGHEAWQRQPWPPAQASELRERLARRRESLARAALALPAPCRGTLRPLLVWCTVADRVAKRCATALPLQYDAGRFDAVAAAWTAWRAAVAATRGRLPEALQENR